MGIAVGLVLLGCALVVAYFISLAAPSREPYPFLADYGSKKKKVVSPVRAPDSSKPGGAVAGTDPAPPATPAPPTPPAVVPAAPVEVPMLASAGHGEQLFNIYCVACHQAGGHGKVGFAPFIRNPDFLALASDDFLRTTITTGRPGTAMVPWAHLKPNEVDSLILYLRSAQDPDAPQVAAVDPSRTHAGDATAGKGLYAQYCASCHGQNATGYAEGGPGPGIGNSGFLAAASDDFIFQTVKHGRIGTPMRPFSGSRGLANLSDEEIGDIIAFLRNRKSTAPQVARAEPDPKAGEMHFQANCAACHQPDGKGRPGFAPSIRNRDFLAIAGDEFIKQTVHNGRVGTAMVMRPDLSDQVLDDIIAFLRAVPVETGVHVQVDPTKNLATLGDAEEGHAKFAVYCASCHGDHGTGFVAGGTGPGIGLPGFLNAASDDYIYQTLRIGRIGTAMKPFLGSKGLANLGDQDAFDIIAYLRGLNPTSD